MPQFGAGAGFVGCAGAVGAVQIAEHGESAGEHVRGFGGVADALDGLAPREAAYRHSIEGPDDMPAHIRAMLTATSLAIPVTGGRMALGTWQAIYLIEHRDRPHSREIVLHYTGTLGR